MMKTTLQWTPTFQALHAPVPYTDVHKTDQALLGQAAQWLNLYSQTFKEQYAASRDAAADPVWVGVVERKDLSAHHGLREHPTGVWFVHHTERKADEFNQPEPTPGQKIWGEFSRATQQASPPFSLEMKVPREPVLALARQQVEPAEG